MKLDQDALVELAKSFARFIWFGLLGLVGTFLTSLVAGGSLNDTHVVIAGTTFNVGFVILAGLTLAIKAIDRYVHVSDSTKLKGLAPAALQN